MHKCDALNDNMIAYRDLYDTLEGDFDGYELRHIGSTCAPIPPRVFLERICECSIKPKAAEKKISAATDSGATPPNEPTTIDDLELDTGLEGPMSIMMIEQS